MQNNPKKTKAFIITFIVVFLLLLGVYFIFANRDKLFGTNGVVKTKVFQSLLGTSKPKPVTTITSKNPVTTERKSTIVEAGENIKRGDIIYIAGYNANGNPIIKKALADGSGTSVGFAIADQDININDLGSAIINGPICNLSINMIGGDSWQPGDQLYLSNTDPGKVTNKAPSASSLSVPVGNTLNTDPSNFCIDVGAPGERTPSNQNFIDKSINVVSNFFNNFLGNGNNDGGNGTTPPSYTKVCHDVATGAVITCPNIDITCKDTSGNVIICPSGGGIPPASKVCRDIATGAVITCPNITIVCKDASGNTITCPSGGGIPPASKVCRDIATGAVITCPNIDITCKDTSGNVIICPSGGGIPPASKVCRDIATGAVITCPNITIVCKDASGNTITCPSGGGTPQCSDSKDNDKDGLIDDKDPNCHIDNDLTKEYTPNGFMESSFLGTPQCSDGKDNDKDGFIDDKDPNCHIDNDLTKEYTPNGFSESSFLGTPQCSDSKDNDKDGLIDDKDPNCHIDNDLTKEYTPNGFSESSFLGTPQCSDSKDNDKDGLIDDKDPNCHIDNDLTKEYTPNGFSESSFLGTPQCSDSKDNDKDGLIDDKDPNCHIDNDLTKEYTPNGFMESSFLGTPQCSDGKDNDKDGFIDDKDPNCHIDNDLTKEYTPNGFSESSFLGTPQCSDSKDNDKDGLIDDKDPNCHIDNDLTKEYTPNGFSESSFVIKPGTGGISSCPAFKYNVNCSRNDLSKDSNGDPIPTYVDCNPIDLNVTCTAIGTGSPITCPSPLYIGKECRDSTGKVKDCDPGYNIKCKDIAGNDATCPPFDSKNFEIACTDKTTGQTIGCPPDINFDTQYIDSKTKNVVACPGGSGGLPTPICNDPTATNYGESLPCDSPAGKSKCTILKFTADSKEKFLETPSNQATLAWQTANCSSVMISSSATRKPSLEKTTNLYYSSYYLPVSSGNGKTTYTLTATNLDGTSVNKTVQITVTPAPVICPDDSIIFTDEEKTKMSDLLRSFYLIVPTLKTQDDIDQVNSDVVKKQDLIEGVDDLTTQCYEEINYGYYFNKDTDDTFDCSQKDANNKQLCDETSLSTLTYNGKIYEHKDYKGPKYQKGNPYYSAGEPYKEDLYKSDTYMPNEVIDIGQLIPDAPNINQFFRSFTCPDVDPTNMNQVREVFDNPENVCRGLNYSDFELMYNIW